MSINRANESLSGQRSAIWTGLLGLFGTFVLTACGGGGGGGTPGAPVADAGADQTTAERQRVTLSGSGSDSDGTVQTYAWTQTQGPSVGTIQNADQATASFAAPEVDADSMAVFRLTVTDDEGKTGFDDVVVQITDQGADGGTAIFLADKDTDERYELFATDVLTSTAMRISAPITGTNAAAADVSNPLVSPDGMWVAYVIDRNFPDVYDLFVASVDGNFVIEAHPPTPQNHRGISGRTVGWSPMPINGDYRLVFAGDIENGNDNLEVYTVGTDGMPTKISAPMVTGGDANNVTWSPDATRIAYTADAQRDGQVELFTAVPDSANQTVKVSNTLVTNGSVLEFYWRADSQRLVYRADQTIDDNFNLYVATPGVSGAIQVSPDRASNRDVRTFAWAPMWSGSAATWPVAYRADHETTDEEYHLYTTTQDGTDGQGGAAFSGVFKESGSMVTSGDVNTFQWSPDGSRLAYQADQESDGVQELYVSVPGNAPAVTKVSPTPSSPNGDVRNYAWAPDSSRIAYCADQRADQVFEIFTSLPDGTSNDRISGDMVQNGSARVANRAFVWSPDSSRIAYIADQRTDGLFELFVSFGTGNAENLVANADMMQDSRGVTAFDWTATSGRLVYIADQDEPEVYALYGTSAVQSPASSQDTPKLSGVMVTDNNGDIAGDVIYAEVAGVEQRRADF